jgi:Ran GTPase-activating protein (RanGAP) involved in mRNA processing and transport
MGVGKSKQLNDIKSELSKNTANFFAWELGDKGTKYITKQLMTNTTVRVLYLNNNGIGDEGARFIGEAIKHNTSITELYLIKNNIGNVGARHITDALKHNTTITVVDLDQNLMSSSKLASFKRNMLKRRAVQTTQSDRSSPAAAAAAASDSKHTLPETQSAPGRGRGPSPAAAVAVTVAASVKHTIDDELKQSTARLNDCKLGDAEVKYVAEQLKRNTTVHKMYIFHNSIGVAGARYLSEAIKHNNVMTHFYIGSNSLGDEGVRYISEALKRNRSIKQIYLSNNSIGDDGARYISDVIRHNTCITTIYLHTNNIGDQGARSIIEALKHNISINKIYLDNNYISASLLSSINKLSAPDRWSDRKRAHANDISSTAASKQQLRPQQHVSANAVTSVSALNATQRKIKAELKKRNANLSYSKLGVEEAKLVADELKDNSVVHKLCIHDNNIGPVGARHIAEALKHNTSITVLEMYNCAIGPEGARHISDALKHNSSITHIFLTKNNIGDDGAHHLIDAIKHNACIKQIHIGKNSISPSVLSSIKQLLSPERLAQRMHQHDSFMAEAGSESFADADVDADADADVDAGMDADADADDVNAGMDADADAVDSVDIAEPDADETADDTADAADSAVDTTDTTVTDTTTDTDDSKLIQIAETVNANVTHELGSHVSMNTLLQQYTALAAKVDQVHNDLQDHNSYVSDRAPSGSVARLLESHKKELLSALNDQQSKLDAIRQTAYISADEHLFDFYFSMQLYMESAFVSARVLHSGQVETSDGIGASCGMSNGSRIASILCRGLKKAGKLIPVIGPLVEALGDVAVSVSSHAAKVGIRRIASSASTTTMMSECMERVARFMCLQWHAKLLHLPASSSAQGIRAALQATRGDVYIGQCAELAKKSVSHLLRDLMLDRSDSNKIVSVPLDTSDSSVLSVCSLLLDHSVCDLSVDAKVQECIDAHTQANMPHVRPTPPATGTVSIPATTGTTSGSISSTSESTSMQFADAADLAEVKVQHSQMRAELAAMRKLFARHKSLQRDEDKSDEDENSSVTVGSGSQQQAMLSAKSKSRKHSNGNSAVVEDEIEALYARIKELEAEQQRAKQHRHGIADSVARVAAATDVEHVFDDGTAMPSDADAECDAESDAVARRNELLRIR